MVEGAPLLREYTGNGIEGSNPFFSAIFSTTGNADRLGFVNCCSARLTRLEPEAASHF